MKPEKIGKVLFVVPSFSNGGAERVVSVLASTLAENGVDTYCIVYYQAKNEYPHSENVKVQYLAGKGEASYKVLGMKEKVERLRHMISQIKPNYIIPFLPQVGFHVFLATFGHKYKVLQTVRNNPRTDPETSYERIIRNIMVAVSWRSFVQNQEQLSYFPPFIQRKLTIIPNPISDIFFESDHIYRKNIKEIVAMGRLSEQKNFNLLINVAKIIHRDYPDVHFSIYGDGPLRDELQKKIINDNLDGIVTLQGRTNSAQKVLNEADAFIMTSNYEGMPNALLEAMAVGLPCISTDCPTGPADIIDDGINGILVPVNNEVALTKAIGKYIEMGEAIAQIGKEAQKLVRDNYSTDVIAHKFIREALQVRE